MTARIIAAALVALAASAGAAHAEIAPSYNADGVCAVYALAVDPRFCEDGVDPVVTGAIEVARENWEQEARKFSQYAYSGLPSGTDLISTGSIGDTDADYIPYLDGAGDPLGLTSSNR